MSTPDIHYLTPGTAVWFMRGGQRHAGTVDARQGGVYRVKTIHDSYLIRREQVSLRRNPTLQHPEVTHHE